VAGNSPPGFAGDGGPAIAAALDFPQDVVALGAGNALADPSGRVRAV